MLQKSACFAETMFLSIGTTLVSEQIVYRGGVVLSVGGIPAFGQSGIDWQKPVRSLRDVREKIDYYDKSTADYFMESTAPWLARNVLAEVGHNYAQASKHNPFYQAATNEIYQALPKTMADWADRKITYNKIFSIYDDMIEKPVEAPLREFLKDKNVQNLYKEVAQGNFKKFKFNPISPTKYLKHVVMQYNIGKVASDLKEGRLLPAMAKSLGLGTLFYSVTTNTHKHYLKAKAEEDGTLWSRLKTVGKTVVGFFQETLKAMAAWELGTIGYMVGSSLICFAGLPSIIAGCIVGGLFETAFKSLFKSLFKDPSDPNPGFPASQKLSGRSPLLSQSEQLFVENQLDLTG